MRAVAGVAAVGLVVVASAAFVLVVQSRDDRDDGDRLAELRSRTELTPEAGWVIARQGEQETCSEEPGGDRPVLWRHAPEVSVEEAVRYYSPRLASAGWKLERSPLENDVPGARFRRVIGDFDAEVIVAPGPGGSMFRAQVTASPDCQ